MTLYLDKKRYLDGTTAPTAPQSACNQRADQSFGMDSVRVGLSVVAGNLVTFASRVYVVCGTANCLCHPGTVLHEVATSGNRSSAELASLDRRHSSAVLIP